MNFSLSSPFMINKNSLHYIWHYIWINYNDSTNEDKSHKTNNEEHTEGQEKHIVQKSNLMLPPPNF